MKNAKIAAFAVLVLFVFSAFSWYQPVNLGTDTSRYRVQPPMDFRGAKAEFGPEQMVWVEPLIRIIGCVFAQKAVRHHLEPEQVSFAPCTDGGEIKTTLDENLIDMTVSGVATVGTTERQFNVVLQHYPPSIDEDGFLVTAIEVR